MRKRTSFLWCLIILLGAAGFVFYTGWSQFKVAPGDIGILVSKTGGTHAVPITHDKFSWNWEFLLPTNAKLMMFSPKTYSYNNKIEGVLPSGKEYAKVYGGATDFSYWFNFKISLSAKKEQIAQLVKANEIASQEDLEKYLEHNAQIASAEAASAVIEAFENGTLQSVSSAEEIISAAARNACKNCELETIALLQYVFPDYALYSKAKNSYDDYIAKMQAAAAEAAKREAEEVSRFGTTIQKMQTLGETLKKYPELSDVIKNSDNITQVLDKINSIE